MLLSFMQLPQKRNQPTIKQASQRKYQLVPLVSQEMRGKSLYDNVFIRRC